MGVGSVLDIDVVHSAIMSGTAGVVLVVRSLLNLYAKDGEITESDIESAFAGQEEN